MTVLQMSLRQRSQPWCRDPNMVAPGPIKTGAQELGHVITLALRETDLRAAPPATLFSEFAIL